MNQINFEFWHNLAFFKDRDALHRPTDSIGAWWWLSMSPIVICGNAKIDTYTVVSVNVAVIQPPLIFRAICGISFTSIFKKLFQTLMLSVGRQKLSIFQPDWLLKITFPSFFYIQISSKSTEINCSHTIALRMGTFCPDPCYKGLIAHPIMAMSMIIWSTNHTFVLSHQLHI